jgi:probable HAF family extracellular repeat protein
MQWAASINNHDAVVGVGGTPERGFLYTGDSPIYLDTYDVWAISDSGLIAGTVHQGGSAVAAVYDTNDTQPKFEPIGHVPGHTYSAARSINDKGEVVGVSKVSDNAVMGRGFLYKDGEMTDLNDLIPAGSGWVLDTGQAINNASEILATGRYEIAIPDNTVLSGWGSCLLVPAHVFRFTREKYRSLWEVLRGLLDDTPGVLWPSGGPPGGPPIPVHPNWRLDPNKQDVLSGLAVNQLASLVNDPEVRRHVEEAGIRVMEESVRKLREGL